MEKKITAIIKLMTTGTEKERKISEILIASIIKGGSARKQAVEYIENI